MRPYFVIEETQHYTYWHQLYFDEIRTVSRKEKDHGKGMVYVYTYASRSEEDAIVLRGENAMRFVQAWDRYIEETKKQRYTESL